MGLLNLELSLMGHRMLKTASIKGRRGVAVSLVMSLLLTFMGCHSGARPSVGGGASDDSQMITVTELARLLELSVSDTDPTHVTLKNRANTVMLFTFSGC